MKRPLFVVTPPYLSLMILPSKYNEAGGANVFHQNMVQRSKNSRIILFKIKIQNTESFMISDINMVSRLLQNMSQNMKVFFSSIKKYIQGGLLKTHSRGKCGMENIDDRSKC